MSGECVAFEGFHQLVTAFWPILFGQPFSSLEFAPLADMRPREGLLAYEWLRLAGDAAGTGCDVPEIIEEGSQ